MLNELISVHISIRVLKKGEGEVAKPTHLEFFISSKSTAEIKQTGILKLYSGYKYISLSIYLYIQKLLDLQKGYVPGSIT